MATDKSMALDSLYRNFTNWGLIDPEKVPALHFKSLFGRMTTEEIYGILDMLTLEQEISAP